MTRTLAELPFDLPAFVTPQFVTSAIVIVSILHIALVAAAYFILLERKICAWVQDRCGPNRVGPLGLLQPIADGLKLFVKEEFMPRGADRGLFILAPALTVFPAMIGFAIIPWAGSLDLSTVPFLNLAGTVKVMGADVSIGIIYLVATASLGVYGVGLGGWASNNKYSFLGGLRATAQMISYEIPLGLCLLCVILAAGTLRADQIVTQQIDGAWFIVQQPLTALLFYVCLLAEANRAPFDLSEAEQELVGGWHTEYSSMKWALFFMGEYIHVFVGSAFFAVLFLGGWSLNPLPFGPDLPAAGGLGLILLQFSVVMGKVVALVALTMVVRWTLPRFRFDQLMRLAWEGMIPTALLLLLVVSIFVYRGWTEYLWAGSLGALAVILFVYPYLPKQANPNHRVPLIGSRFSPLEEGDLSPAVD
ncbi:MAG: NADH-quinone oxidoreductase subunit NuoH [Phycisphaerales bacterium]|nr:NADH-quinone oxidoreductase subunit NuoH [Phycisphaerales bacterium]